MITIDHMHFEVIENYRDAFDPEQFRDKYSEVLNKYDYIVGDIGYEKLRLAGFFRDDKAKADRDKKFSAIQDYLYEYCNFGCAYFVLRKVPKSEIKEMKEQGRFEEPETGAEPVAGEAPVSDREASGGEVTDADRPEGAGGEGAASRGRKEVPQDQDRGNRQPRRKKTSRGKKKPGQQKGKQNSSQMPSGKTLAEHQSPKKPD
ncbi:YutD family protein [Salinicoccus carnicancri]|uniref:YutD family protein n=1 Tax=Salinicoccus carnicancri TaxID=558170 RepID=UPI000316D3F3|nr:YutD family protein [Salinicoccus carnicancri]